MSESQLRGYRLLIVPGGNFINIGNSLNASTTATIRNVDNACAGTLVQAALNRTSLSHY